MRNRKGWGVMGKFAMVFISKRNDYGEKVFFSWGLLGMLFMRPFIKCDVFYRCLHYQKNKSYITFGRTDKDINRYRLVSKNIYDIYMVPDETDLYIIKTLD